MYSRCEYRLYKFSQRNIDVNRFWTLQRLRENFAKSNIHTYTHYTYTFEALLCCLCKVARVTESDSDLNSITEYYMCVRVFKERIVSVITDRFDTARRRWAIMIRAEVYCTHNSRLLQWNRAGMSLEMRVKFRKHIHIRIRPSERKTYSLFRNICCYPIVSDSISSKFSRLRKIS